MKAENISSQLGRICVCVCCECVCVHACIYGWWGLHVQYVLIYMYVMLLCTTNLSSWKKETDISSVIRSLRSQLYRQGNKVIAVWVMVIIPIV